MSSDHDLILARLRNALAHHNTSPSNFGKNIWDHLEVVSCEAVEDTQPFDELLTNVNPNGKVEKLEEGRGVVTPVREHAKGVKRKGRVVIEATVKKEWLNPVGGLHGAATAYLVDICTSLALMTISTSDFWPGLGGVSQNMTIHYAGPAFEGDRIRIDSRTLNVGKLIANMRCDITNAKTGALVAAGTHSKVEVFGRKKGKIEEVSAKIGYKGGDVKQLAKL